MNTSDRRKLEVARELLTSILDQSTVDVEWDGDLASLARLLIEKTKSAHPGLPDFPTISQPWRILLLLYVAEVDGINVAITDLAVMTGVAPTTSLRYQSLLLDDKLVARVEDPMHGRRVWLTLTDEAREIVKSTLADFGRRFLSSLDANVLAQVAKR